MRKLFWTGFFAAVSGCLFALVLSAHGQDVSIPTSSPYITLARGNSWGSFGACGSGPGCGVNNSYVWTPVNPDSTVCIGITNLNPTSAHNVTLALSQALDSAVTTFSGNTQPWATVPITGTTFPFSIPASSMVSFFFRSSSAAKLALVVSGTSTQPGSPDTANIVVAQPSTASWCGSAGSSQAIVTAVGPTPNGSAIPASLASPVQVGGQGMSGSNYNGLAQVIGIDPTTKGVNIGALNNLAEGSSPPAGISPSNYNNGSTFVGTMHVTPWGQQTDVSWGQGAGDTASPLRISRDYGLMTTTPFGWASDLGSNNAPLRTFSTQTDQVNPAAGAVIAGVQTQTSPGTNGLKPYRFIVGCSAACDVKINKTTTAGTTCPAGTVNKTWDTGLAGPSPTNIAIAGACAANPTVQFTMAHLWIAAGTSQTFDATGYYWQGGVAAGFGFDVVEGGALTGTASVTIEWMER